VTLIVFYLVFMRCQRTTVSDLTMVMVSRMRDSDDKQNEHGTVGPTQMQSMWCSLLQSVELMRSTSISACSRQSRLEAVIQQADEKEGNCNHSAIMF
jgi:hypothetical protein